MLSKFLRLAVQFWFIINCTSEDNLLKNATIESPYFRVKNGEPAELGDVPYQVAFRKRALYGSKYGVFCGGALVGPSTVLTAAHCFAYTGILCCRSADEPDKTKVERSYAVAGTIQNQDYYTDYDSDDRGQWRKIKRATLSKNYRFPRNDICMVITQRPFVYNEFVQPVSYSRHHMEYTGQCLLSGFGMTSEKSSSKVLLVAYVEVLPTRLCKMRQNRNMEKFVCTSNDESDAAKGDSGGPLVCKNTGDPLETDRGLLVGVVSGQTVNIRKRASQTYFTRISSYYNFIKENTDNEDSVRKNDRRRKASNCDCFKANVSLILSAVLLNWFIIF